MDQHSYKEIADAITRIPEVPRSADTAAIPSQLRFSLQEVIGLLVAGQKHSQHRAILRDTAGDREVLDPATSRLEV